MMRKTILDRGDVLSVAAKPEDAVARLRRHRASIRERLRQDQQPLLTNAERDIVLVAIAQTLNLL